MFFTVYNGGMCEEICDFAKRLLVASIPTERFRMGADCIFKELALLLLWSLKCAFQPAKLRGAPLHCFCFHSVLYIRAILQSLNSWVFQSQALNEVAKVETIVLSNVFLPHLHRIHIQWPISANTTVFSATLYKKGGLHMKWISLRQLSGLTAVDLRRGKASLRWTNEANRPVSLCISSDFYISHYLIVGSRWARL